VTRAGAGCISHNTKTQINETEPHPRNFLANEQAEAGYGSRPTRAEEASPRRDVLQVEADLFRDMALARERAIRRAGPKK